MTREVIAVYEGAWLEEIAEILEKHRIKRVTVVQGDKLVRIVSRANLLHGLIAHQTGVDPSIDDRKIKTTVVRNLSDAGVRPASQRRGFGRSSAGLERRRDARGAGGRAGRCRKRARRESGPRQCRYSSDLYAPPLCEQGKR